MSYPLFTATLYGSANAALAAEVEYLKAKSEELCAAARKLLVSSAHRELEHTMGHRTHEGLRDLADASEATRAAIRALEVES